MAMVIVIDNYDSFTYNLVQYLGELGAEPVVRRNDAITVEDVGRLGPTAIVLSPGPCAPAQAGITVETVRRWGRTIPMLGVCLGHQALAVVLGGRVVAAPRVVHGKASPIYHDGRTLYAGLPNPFPAGRYHSLCVDDASLPTALSVCAFTSQGEVMGLRAADLRAEGVQFHPESVLTPSGERLLANFLEGETS